MNQRILVWGLVVLGVVGIVLALVGIVSQNPNGNGNNKTEILLAEPVSDSDWYLGGKDAKVVLVEYSDFQCPACAFYSGIMEQLAKNLGADIKIVYRHFPLPQHQNAKLAAAASEAAGRQGKFWEMSNLIFQNQTAWQESDKVGDLFSGYASSLGGIDAEKFNSEIKLKEVSDKIERDLDSGNRSGVKATPTFFLNGKQIINPKNYDEFKALISKELGQV